MNSSPIRIESLGHAGFVVEFADTRLLIDPWFFPAFLASWFPWPDNRFLWDRLSGCRFDYLYISHLHEDHFDRRVLTAMDKGIRVLCPDYRSHALQRRLDALGFRDVVPLGHQESVSIGLRARATMYLDTSHKEDSALLLDIGGFRFFDMNDCNTPLSELPKGVDLLAAQYSGAMWYPNCYDYEPAVLCEKVARVRADLMDTLVRKCRATDARAYLPSAGPACFLDPVLWPYNDRTTTIFPVWDNVKANFTAACPDVSVVIARPGDAVAIHDGTIRVEAVEEVRPSDDLADYSRRRATEWSAFHDGPEPVVTQAEIAAYFAKLQRRNRHLLHDFSKRIRLVADSRTWQVHLGELAEDFVIEGEEPYDAEYALLMAPRVLRAILDGHTGWEEALLSMRVRLRRNPDVFDSCLMGLLRYGNEPAQTLQMAREKRCEETIEHSCGLRLQRYCPHAGEDLTHATVSDGLIECPRHHWKWDVRTGECVEGGDLRLRIEPASTPEPVGQPRPAGEEVRP